MIFTRNTSLRRCRLAGGIGDLLRFAQSRDNRGGGSAFDESAALNHGFFHCELHFPFKRRKSFSFSHTQSSSSVSGINSHPIRAVHGFLYAFGSSIVTCTSMCPKSNRRTRSTICRASL